MSDKLIQWTATHGGSGLHHTISLGPIFKDTNKTKIKQTRKGYKNSIRDTCSTADILDCPRYAPDEAPDMPQTMPQLVPQTSARHAPDDAPYMPQMMPQTCPRHAPYDAPEMPQGLHGHRGHKGH